MHFLNYSVTNHLLPLPRVHPSVDHDPLPRVHPSADCDPLPTVYLSADCILKDSLKLCGKQAPTERASSYGDRLTSANSSLKARPGWQGER